MQHYFSTEVSSHGFFTSVIFAGFLASELKYASNAKLLAYETEICGLMQRKFAHIQYFSGEPTKFKSAPSPRTEPFIILVKRVGTVPLIPYKNNVAQIMRSPAKSQ